MERNPPDKKKLFLLDTWTILFAVVTYCVGGGFVSYLGKVINWLAFWTGLIIVVLFIVSFNFIYEFFRLQESKAAQKSEKDFRLRTIYLQFGLTTLTIGAVLTVLLYSVQNIGVVVWLFLAIFFIMNLSNAVPPLSLKKSGYGELVSAVNIAVLAPAFSVSLQLGDIHPTLVLITFPMFFLFLSMFLAISLEGYFEDIKTNRNTLMTRLGWKTGINLHNIFILMTFFIYGLSTLLGLSWQLSYPVFFSIPIAIIQFWEMVRINEGHKPRWKLLRLSSIGTVAVLNYFLLFRMWLG
ncbi:MAG: hypothetical protein CVU39_02115 [Chloroflexi bacterium HGW-Chloroflexi-10]|nr:MAG: hypothetical protein CVU39_02115 [Chloroflexi bacterium HGW-Chloroflexi-10]